MAKRTVGTKRIKKPKNWEEIYRLWEGKKIKSKDAVVALGLTSYGFYTLVKQQRELDKPIKEKEKVAGESYVAWKRAREERKQNG